MRWVLVFYIIMPTQETTAQQNKARVKIMNALTKQTLRTYWRASMRYPWQATTVLSGAVGLTVLTVYIPLLYRDLINMLSVGDPRASLAPALRIVVLILVLNFTRTTFWRLTNFVNNNFLPRVMSDLMNMCYQYLHRHSVGFFNSNFVGSLVTKVKRYERSFEQIADQIIFDLGRSILDSCIIFGILVWQYPKIGSIIFAWAVLFFAFSYYYSLFKLPYDIKRAAADTDTTAQLADSITNNANVKLFTNYRLENERFKDVTERQYRLRRKSWDLGTWGDVVQSLSSVALEFAIIYLAVLAWQKGTLMVGDIALIQLYLIRVFDKLWGTGRNIRNIYEALADANEMTEMLLRPHEVEDAPAAKALKVKNGKIEFQNVSFSYHKEAAVLRDFDLAIAPGEKVAFVGPSGGGKSTIVKLLFRFYDIERGEILIDGQNIAKVKQDSLRSALSLVPQEPILFHRSLMENIRYARPEATGAEVVRAAKLAHADEFISSFSQGYETLVGERGVKLSGGERQRVAIARAILKDAPILILDEATSSLDSESEMFIQDALRKLMQKRTTIVIAHRLSTIMQMDRIVVIDGGKIVEQGKHRELLKAQEGLYQKLWEIQAGGFAPA